MNGIQSHRITSYNVCYTKLLRLVQELKRALEQAQGDDAIGAIVLTGSEKAFAAGADIAVMRNYSHMDAFMSNYSYNFV